MNSFYIHCNPNLQIFLIVQIRVREIIGSKCVLVKVYTTLDISKLSITKTVSVDTPIGSV